jgi:hypothetical protein
MRIEVTPFSDYCSPVEEHLKRRYGIEVVTRDVPDPLAGDLDGADLHVDHALTHEQRLFLLAHLFGHTVQWNVRPGACELGRPLTPPVEAALVPALIEYEWQVAGYGLGLPHEVGIRELDQMAGRLPACDTAYLEHWYRTGEKRGVSELLAR